MIISFLNSYVINLAIIVATVFGLYFTSLKHYLIHEEVEAEFIEPAVKLNMSTTMEILLGLFIGLMCFFISMNRIPVDNMRPVDVRYLPVYFSVYYGSPMTGIITTITLILTKSLEYFFTNATQAEIINNFVITLAILAISIIIDKKKLGPKKAILTCLVSILIIRFLLATFILFREINQELLIHFFLHFLVFSSLFLLTGWMLNNAIMISERIHVYRTSSVFDSLTGVYNKEAFYFFLDIAYNEAINEQKEFSLALIDLDNFKKINDTYGHLIGDKVLSEVTASFKIYAKNYPTLQVFRIGGDELAVIFKQEDLPNQYLKNINSTLTNLNISQNFNNELISLSVGLIHFSPQDYAEKVIDVEEIFSLADQTLYEAKKAGKKQVIEKTIYFTGSHNKKAQTRN
ncbi:GGDEF domain-containing protein [Vagococcus carniphilus]|uniref:GGDEF domain-containing protein n=1 Tax=Vagococcus carniphilus TaxID=218144 RepID=A0AAW8UB59_9ENTE|nr:GGDEF domain-containing protein [Vagococcus carniphilus]MDT2834235.1 GGDEF domain-containing protein [Vagococcus carniphilus]